MARPPGWTLSAALGNDPRTDAEKLEDLREAYDKAVAALREIKQSAINNLVAGNEYFDEFDPCAIVDNVLKELGELK